MAAYKITISANSGTGGTTAFYFDSVSGKFFGSADLETEISSIIPHTRESHRFIGCYSTNATTGSLRVDQNGAIVGWTPTGSTTVYAQWERVSWKVTINDYGGAGGSGSIYCRVNSAGDRSRFYSDDMCYGQPISSVAKPTRSGYAFAGYHNGTSTPGAQYVDKDGSLTDDFFALSITSEKTIYARWTGVRYTLFSTMAKNMENPRR